MRCTSGFGVFTRADFGLISAMPYIADQVAVLAGGQCALFSAALCLLEHGDEVIVMDPTYVTWLDIAKLCCQHDLWQ